MSPTATSTPLRHPGQYHDPETRLHYNHHRSYDPATASHLSPDPLGLEPAPDPHAYVPNPLVWSDPLGLSPVTPLGLAFSKFWKPVDTMGSASTSATT